MTFSGLSWTAHNPGHTCGLLDFLVIYLSFSKSLLPKVSHFKPCLPNFLVSLLFSPTVLHCLRQQWLIHLTVKVFRICLPREPFYNWEILSKAIVLLRFSQFFLIKCSPGFCVLLVSFQRWKRLILTVLEFFCQVFITFMEGQSFEIPYSTTSTDITSDEALQCLSIFFLASRISFPNSFLVTILLAWCVICL